MFDFGSMIYTVPALLIAITIHEYAHAVTADAMGDPTPRYLGRLTFNPLAHLDILGAVMLALFHFGWAKPVAINPNNFRNRREGMIKVSLAGPAANLFLCFLAALIMVVMSKFNVLTPGVSAFLLCFCCGPCSTTYGLPFLTCCRYRRWTVRACWMNFCRLLRRISITPSSARMAYTF